MQQNIGKLISHWLKQDVITAQQAERMRSDIKLDTSHRTKNRLIAALSTMGAMTVGIGVILFVASNWDVLPRAFKLFMAVALPVIPLCLAYWVSFIKTAYIALGRGVLIIGILLIGAAMAIIGQVYNLEPEYTRFLGVWILLALPFVLIFKRTVTVMILSVLGGAWIFAFVLDTVFKGANEELIFAFSPVLYLAYAACLYGIGRVCSPQKNGIVNNWQQSGKYLRILGAKIGIVSLFITTFSFYAKTLGDIGSKIPVGAMQIIFNVAFIAFLIYVLIKAIRSESESVISMVFFWFGLFILVHYFDLFWKMLPTSMFFIAGGILFMGGAFLLERQRKKLLSGFEPDSVMNVVDYNE